MSIHIYEELKKRKHQTSPRFPQNQTFVQTHSKRNYNVTKRSHKRQKTLYESQMS